MEISLATDVSEDTLDGVDADEEDDRDVVDDDDVSASLCKAGLCLSFLESERSASSSSVLLAFSLGLSMPLEVYSAQEAWTSESDSGVLFSRLAARASKQNRQCSTVAMMLS